MALTISSALLGARIPKKSAPAAAAAAPAQTLVQPAAPAPLPARGQPHPQPSPQLLSPASLLVSLRELGAWVAVTSQRKATAEAFPAAWSQAASVLATHSAGLQDVAAAVALCEGVYRADDHGEQQAEVAIQRLQAQLPAAPRISAVQWSPPQQEQRYVVAHAGDAVVVAFLGTKRPADHLVNLRLVHTPVFKSPLADAAAGGGGGTPAAHSGYLQRSQGIPVEQLYRLARVQGKRLVLAGHSLGGAVATLCAVRLLDALPQDLHHTVSCIGFAVPPVGNAELAAVVEANGWADRITNYTLPEDFVPGLLGLLGRQGDSGASAPAFAGQAAASTFRSAPTATECHERTSVVLGGTGVRLLAALATLPHHLIPHHHQVGRQISLPAGAVPRAPPNHQPHDPLVPSYVSGRLAAHRMITYRVRIAALYTPAATA